MIDLKPHIRDHILASAVAEALPVYRDTRRVFTKRPAPTDGDGALFPVVLVSTTVATAQRDFVDAPNRTVTHYLSTFGRVEEDYRAVEAIAHSLAMLYDREKHHPAPTGWRVYDTVSTSPTDAPTSDDKLMGLVVAVQLMFTRED